MTRGNRRCVNIGDEVFFTRPDAQGKALVDILGADCNPNNSNQLCDAMTQLRHNAVAWREVRRLPRLAVKPGLIAIGPSMLHHG